VTASQATNILALLVLAARVGDVLSTYLVTPKLKLEGNPLVRRFSWPFAIFSVSIAIIPYFSMSGGIIVLVVSLLVCASNFSKVWFARAMGEDEYHDLIIRMASKAPLLPSLLFILAPSACMAIVGISMLYFYPDPAKDWGFYFSMSFLAYALAIGLYGSLGFLRFRKEGRAINRSEQRVSASAKNNSRVE
jgi:hypothetical protein